tara:strand:+ start:253 stop:660 length:408 start_codon:yes stop_codon:yes gene_type:complete
MPDDVDYNVLSSQTELRNTLKELELLGTGDVIGYYESRIQRGDPYAPLAIQVAQNSGVLGRAANIELRADIRLAHAIGRQVKLPSNIDEAVQQVRIDLANIYAEQVDLDIRGRIHLPTGGRVRIRFCPQSVLCGR